MPTPAPTEDVTAKLRRRIGRLLIVGFRGTTLAEAPEIETALRAGELGGVILFDRDGLTQTAGRNITSPAQLEALTAELRAAARDGHGPGELLISVDQEGGRVARLGPQDGYPATTSQADLGAAGDLALTTDVATATAETLRSAGIDLNLAPVVDLNLNPDNPAIGALDRSFSDDPEIVVAQATAVVDAHHSVGVRCAIKHFPGEGSATGNTDEGIVDVTTTWTDVELEPFRRLVEAAVPDAVMVGHIVNDQFDPDLPAALSRATVTGLLRDELGWFGPVISDDLQAGAITAAFGADEAIALALEAGVDLLLFANQQVYDPEVVDHVIATVIGLLESGRITESRLDESITRLTGLTSPVE